MRADIIRKIALLACLVLPIVMTHAAHADNVGSGPPLPPKTLTPPEQPIVAASSDGYLPTSWDVTPTGAFAYTIPLKVPDGRAAMQPSLSLSYSSNGGNGLMGVGWAVSGLSRITRCGRTLASNGRTDGVSFSSSDRFCLDGQRLVAIGGVGAGSGEYGDIDTEYRTEADTFARIISTGPDTLDGKGPQEFIVYTKHGHIQKYKAVEAKRIATYLDGSASVEGEVRAMWLLSSEEDRLGNMIRYEYTIAQGNGPGAEDYALDVRPYHISYTSNLSQGVSAYRYVEFVYEGRPDNDKGWQSGILQSTPTRLQSIGMYAPNPTIISKVWQCRVS